MSTSPALTLSELLSILDGRAAPLELSPANVVRAARALAGVRFRHMGRDPRHGLDCAGSVFVSGRACGELAGVELPRYHHTPNPALLMATLRLHLRELRPDELAHGDVAVMRLDAEPQHLGIITQDRWPLGLIHVRRRTVEGVCEHPLDGHWLEGVVGAFRFGGLR